MATNLALDDDLIVQAQQLGGHATKKAAVTEALLQYIRRRKQGQALALFAQVDFNPDYDYKAARKGQHGLTGHVLTLAQPDPPPYLLQPPPPVTARPTATPVVRKPKSAKR